MAAGIQIFNANGSLSLDTSTLVGKVLGQHRTTQRSGTISVPNFSLGDPFAFVVPEIEQMNSLYLLTSNPKMTYTSNSLSWELPSTSQENPPPIPLNIYYGVY